MTPAVWPPSIHPAARNPRLWNGLLDAVTQAYRALDDGDQLAGVFVKVRDGAGRAFLIIRTDGVVRRVPVGASELEYENKRSEETACLGERLIWVVA